MDYEKLKSEIKKLLGDKKISSTLAVLLLLLFILIIVNFYYPKSKTNTNTNTNINAVQTSGQNDSTDEMKNYETSQKNDLIEILKKIKGVNNVDVIMSFEGGEVKVPAYDKNTQNTTTEETSKDGSTRVNNQATDGSKVVITSEGGEDKPFILQTYKPKVTGVIVVCGGAEDSKVKHDIEVAVANLYDLPANKVNVYPSKN